jgi:serine/threonine-protein kinase RsbT
MHVTRHERLALRCEEDLVKTRKLVRDSAKELGFSLIDQTKLVTASSELARNALVYGGGGMVEVEVVGKGTARGLQISFVDQGPGIVDIERALSDGYTSGNGLGLGLGGSKRLVHDLEIRSRAGEGTTVKITMWK